MMNYKKCGRKSDPIIKLPRAFSRTATTWPWAPCGLLITPNEPHLLLYLLPRLRHALHLVLTRAAAFLKGVLPNATDLLPGKAAVSIRACALITAGKHCRPLESLIHSEHDTSDMNS